jgi:hypothetical protein
MKILVSYNDDCTIALKVLENSKFICTYNNCFTFDKIGELYDFIAACEEPIISIARVFA